VSPDAPPTSTSETKLDKAGAWASALCAAHCAIVAVAPGLLMAVGLGGLMSHEFEWIITTVAVLIGLLAGVQGYRKHGSGGLLAGFVVMAGALVAARFLEKWIASGGEISGMQLPYLPVIFAVLAGVGMAWMHILNLQRNRKGAAPSGS